MAQAQNTIYRFIRVPSENENRGKTVVLIKQQQCEPESSIAKVISSEKLDEKIENDNKNIEKKVKTRVSYRNI